MVKSGSFQCKPIVLRNLSAKWLQMTNGQVCLSIWAQETNSGAVRHGSRTIVESPWYCMIFLLETRERAKRTPVVEPAVLLQEVVQEFVDWGEGGSSWYCGWHAAFCRLRREPPAGFPHPQTAGILGDFGEIGCAILAEDRVLPERSSNDAVVLVCYIALDVLACALGRASRDLQSTIMHWANKFLNLAAFHRLR